MHTTNHVFYSFTRHIAKRRNLTDVPEADVQAIQYVRPQSADLNSAGADPDGPKNSRALLDSSPATRCRDGYSHHYAFPRGMIRRRTASANTSNWIVYYLPCAGWDRSSSRDAPAVRREHSR